MRLLLAILLALICCSWAQELTLTYITEHELDQADNYVQVSLSLALEGRSLRNCIIEAEDIIDEIKKLTIKYCQKYAASKEQKSECKESVEVSEFQVEPKYHNIRKVKTFSSFIVSYDITLSVHHTKSIGSLIDTVLAIGGENLVLEEIVWKALKEEDPQINAIREGIEQGEQMCAKFGKKMAEIISVDELQEPKEEDAQEEEERDQDLAEEEVELTTMRFKVKCQSKK